MATILVVDDNAATVEVVTWILKDAGYHVLAVHDGQAALRVLQVIRVQLVLTDLRMPLLDGRHLCATLAADSRYHTIPRVLMSIWWHVGRTVPNVTAFVPKPFTIPFLLTTVQRYAR